MKIQHSFDRAASLLDSTQKDEKKVKDSRGISFQSQYRRTQEENTQERVSRLLEEIGKQGELLSSRVDIRELKRYKQLISEFLNETVNNSHKFLKENMLDRRGRHRVWAVVKKVNEELENLTQEVLKEEKDNINILKCMEDIRGLLLDIVM
ncbi:MAG TPA: DUF327 domain-containing protein [Clostridiales bacterium]|nr:DUF327 domain-containing protein [Clostridiales bacterium]